VINFLSLKKHEDGFEQLQDNRHRKAGLVPEVFLGWFPLSAFHVVRQRHLVQQASLRSVSVVSGAETDQELRHHVGDRELGVVRRPRLLDCRLPPEATRMGRIRGQNFVQHSTRSRVIH